jgi:hypothetical protein
MLDFTGIKMIRGGFYFLKYQKNHIPFGLLKRAKNGNDDTDE